MNLASWGFSPLHNFWPLLGYSLGKGIHHGIESSTSLRVRSPGFQAISATDLAPSATPSHNFTIGALSNLIKPCLPILRHQQLLDSCPTLPFPPQSSSLNQGPTPIFSSPLLHPHCSSALHEVASEVLMATPSRFFSIHLAWSLITPFFKLCFSLMLVSSFWTLFPCSLPPWYSPPF